MRIVKKAIEKIDEEIKTLEALRNRLPEGTDGIGAINAEIDLLKRVRERMAAALEVKPREKKVKKEAAAQQGKK